MNNVMFVLYSPARNLLRETLADLDLDRETAYSLFLSEAAAGNLHADDLRDITWDDQGSPEGYRPLTVAEVLRALATID